MMSVILKEYDLKWRACIPVIQDEKSVKLESVGQWS